MPSIINATTTTGLVSSADNSGSLQLATNNGTTAVTIDTNQQVGIGTASPSSLLTVKGEIRREFASNTALYTTVNYDGISVKGAQDAYYLVDSGRFHSWYTGASERMRISSAGYVTMPNQPAFMAYRTVGPVSGTGIYICDTVTFNDGSNYNSSTGRFTAPVTGRYQLNFFVLMQNGNNVDFHIRVGGVQYAGIDIRDNNATSGNFTLSCSAILKLVANDAVDPYIAFQGAGSVYGNGLNGFSMYFLG